MSEFVLKNKCKVFKTKSKTIVVDEVN